jgi:nucleoid DNA-binding protein
MNKSEFISAIGNRTLKKDAEVKAIIDAATDIIREKLSEGENVAITGFGAFETRERAATTARNPRTGETVEVPARKVPAFKPAKALKDAVDAE